MSSLRFAVLGAGLFVGMLHAQTPASQAKPPAKGTGVVMGRVLDAGTGQPISEAIVTLDPDPREQSENMAALRQARQGGDFTSFADMAPRQNRVLTDADGVFVFRDHNKGSISFRAVAAGYLDGSLGQEKGNSSLTRLQLEDAGRVVDVKIKLMRAVVIAGTVVDDRNEPAIGATVYVYANAGSGSSIRDERGMATTDDRGMYRIAQLPPGEYVVGVPQMIATTPVSQMDSMLKAASSMAPDMRSFGDSFASMAGRSGGPAAMRIGDLMVTSMSGLLLPPGKDGRISIYESVFYPGVQRLSQAQAIHTESGEERTGIDLQLHLVPASVISGSVTGPSGPIRNAPVRLQPIGAETTGIFSSMVATTNTKADGTFTLLGVPDGEYVATVDIEPRPELPEELKSNPMIQAMLGASSTSKTALFGRMPVTVRGSDVPDLAMVVGEGATISGTVRFEGQTAKPTPQAMLNAQIELKSATDSWASHGSGQRSRLNADGTFKTGSYPPGRYSAQVVPGDSAWTAKSLLVEGHDVLREAVDLTGRDLSGAILTFTDKPAELNGVVRSDTPVLPDGVVVLVFPQDYRAWIANGTPGALTQGPMVQKGGAYRVGQLLSGDYLVAAFVMRDNLPTQDPTFFEAVSRVATRVSIGDGERKTLDLRLVEIKR